MEDDDQPIIYIGKEEQNKKKIQSIIIPSDSDEDYQESSKNESETEEYKRRKFNIFYNNLIDFYMKRQYKKLLNTTDPDFESNWLIIHIRLEAIHKIINRKFIKYSNSKLEGIIHWLKQLDTELNNFIMLLYNNNSQEDEKYTKEKLEIIITFSLKQCYNYARFCLHEYDIIQAIKFLAIGERLIKATSDFVISPNTIYYSSHIFLFLGSIFIGNKDYETAKNYIITALKLFYKDIEIRIYYDIDQNSIHNTLFDVNQFPDYKSEKLSKNFFYMSIACYQLGVCYENEYDIYKALQVYQQAKFFAKLLPYKKGIEYIKSLFELVSRQKLRLDIIDFFNNEDQNILINDDNKNKTVKLPFREEEKKKKFEKIENFISNLKLDEVDDDEPDLLNKVNSKPYGKKVGIVTKQIHVLNYLMSDEFHNVINEMNKIEINKLNPETKVKIQKNIRNIKNNERLRLELFKKENNYSKQFSERISEHNINPIYNNYIKENNGINNFRKAFSHKINYSQNLFNQNSSLPKIQENKTINENENEILNKKKIFKLNLNENKKKFPKFNFQSKQKIKNEIPRYKNNSMLFNKKYCKKKAFLEEQYDKELKFQKAMLRCKTEEKETVQNFFNEMKVRQEAEDFYNTTLLKKIMENNEKNRTKKIENDLNSRNIVKPKIGNYYSKSRINETYDFTLNEHFNIKPNEHNQEVINDITNEISYIKKKEFLLSKLKNK